MFKHRIPILPASTALLLASGVPSALAAVHTYYIGTDTLQTISSGTYAGQANPNYQRLTLLLAHDDHFHRLGGYTLTGSAASPVATVTNARVPESSYPNLPLQAGTGAFAGRLVSAPTDDPVIGLYSNLTFAPFHDLQAYDANDIAGEPEDILYNSSAGRYRTSLAGSDVHLELLTLTPGLNMADAAGNPLFAAGPGELHLGDGDTFGLFNPWFWTTGDAAPGVYSATFRLTDEAGLYGDSGEFRFDFEVVPEPGTTFLAAASLLALLPRRRRAGTRSRA